MREVLRAQAGGRPWAQAQIRLRIAYCNFIRYFGPINHTVISTITDAETGEERETHRRPNLAPFADDPDCWLVASIEDYDLESGLARKGPIFRRARDPPPATPLITTAADALAVTLNEIGHVDLERLAELLDCDPETRWRSSARRCSAIRSTEALGDGRRLPLRSRPHQARRRRGGRRTSIRNTRATSRRCGRCSPKDIRRRTSPRGSARRGYRPPTSRRSPPR